MRTKNLAFTVVCFLIFTVSYAADNFAVYYSDKLPAYAFFKYSLLVFDSQKHPDLLPLKEREKELFAYLSLGEINNKRWYFKRMRDKGLLLSENTNWPGAFAVDIRNPVWASFVIEELIPPIIRQGFNGVFIDTLDTAIELERKDPLKYKGMTKAAIDMIRGIRLNYPELKIMLNRAYPIIPKVKDYINVILAESLFSTYDFRTKKYKYVPEAQYKKEVEILKKALEGEKTLKVYTLDYREKSDKEGIKKIYKLQRANGFIPYVSTIELNELTAELPDEKE